MRLDLLQELLFLDQTLGVDALVVANLAQLLDPQLLPVGRLRVKFLVVLELAHLPILLLKAVAEALGVDATRERRADVALDAARGAFLGITHTHVVAHLLVLALGAVAPRSHLLLHHLHVLALLRRQLRIDLADHRFADLAFARILLLGGSVDL